MSKYEVQDIFNLHIDEYLAHHGRLSEMKYKAISAIRTCRTGLLGGHVNECAECGYVEISYNSCRNRNCPKCQTYAKEKWIDGMRDNLINVPYFHVVFTIPEELNMVAYYNQEILYKILFDSAAETLKELSADKKYLGAEIGFTSVLHTWGANLLLHPHNHVIVPAGGIGNDGNLKMSSKKFFIPVRVLSSKFRGKFLYKLKMAYTELKFKGKYESLYRETEFQSLIDSCYKKNWVVYCKETFSGPEAVIEYLGRYTHKIAISNSRILNLEDGKVTFKWRDYRDNKEKIMTITADEFIRRFLMHVLPKRFIKIRHYGIMANRNRRTKLKICQIKAGRSEIKAKFKDLNAVEIITKMTGRDVTKCPCCKTGTMNRKKFNHIKDISPP